MKRDPFVEAVQAKLKTWGYDPGPIDGLAGEKTRKAISAFQRERGLTVSGMVTADTWAKLDAVPAYVDGVPFPDRSQSPSEADQPAMLWPKQADCVRFYGPVGENQTRLILPYAMRLAWDTAVTITTITLHEKVHDSARRVFDRVADAFDVDRRRELGINLFGGSLNVRRMRGGSAWSMHSWGIAIDFDPIRNQLKWGANLARLGKPDAAAFWRLWEEEGWVSLGRQRNFDWMHVQAARL